jgi:hypothetical protein
MKWFIAFAAVLVLGVFIYTQRNATKTTYVNGLPAYNELPGREYIFEHDCYIFQFKKAKTSWPLAGANDPALPVSVAELPREISEKNIGAAFPTIRILDIVRTGSRFRIVSVRRDQRRDGTTVSFEVLLTDEADRRYPRLDAFYMLDHSPESQGAAPKMLESYAVERVKK